MRSKLMIAGGSMALLFALGACSGKSDQAGGNTTTTTTTSTTTPAAAAARMPKAGLWEMTVTAASLRAPMKSQICMPEPTPGSNPFAPPTQSGQTCAKNVITPTATGYTLDMDCEMSGMKVAIAGTVSGDFTTNFKTETTTTMSGPNVPPAAAKGVKSTLEAKYIGACPSGMKPGESKQG